MKQRNKFEQAYDTAQRKLQTQREREVEERKRQKALQNEELMCTEKS